MGKLAVKTLTGSDLTLFEWQFRNRNTGNQKSINLNADVFIDRLYPSMPTTDVGRTGRVPLDLFIYGPGHARVWNIQRKIIKGGTYKNWRLNGEYIPNPHDQLTRFDVLEPGDYVIFDFEGDFYPTAARAVFVSSKVAEDANLHTGLRDFGVGSMIAIDLSQLSLIVHASGTPEIHPVYELLLDAAIEDAAQGGLEGTQKLRSRRNGRRMTRAELERARQRASDVGQMGEELIDVYFASQLSAGIITDYTWASIENAIEPFDFLLRPQANISQKVEVKSTCGDFNQVFHVSMSELLEMELSQERYDLYRVYALDEGTGQLRIAQAMKGFASSVLAHLRSLPAGVRADSVSIRPNTLAFGEEITIDITEADDQPSDNS